MRGRKKWIALFAVMALALIAVDVDAQCAMCKAVAEDSAEGSGYAAGINKGIVYLMGVPYVLLIAWFLFFFRKKIKGFFRDFNAIH